MMRNNLAEVLRMYRGTCLCGHYLMIPPSATRDDPIVCECGRMYWSDGANYHKKEPDRGHIHVEAFCLMRYRCDSCKFSEVYWNSRDGVTPFGRGCPRCKNSSMKHVDWNLDLYSPDHVPERGQGIWIDLPESLKRPLALARIESAKGTDFEVAPEEVENIVKTIIASFHKGEPFLIRWGV